MGDPREAYKLNEIAARFWAAHLQAAPLEYIRRRGFDAAIVKQWGIGYAPPQWDSLKNYLTECGANIDLAIEIGLLSKSDTGRVYDFFRDRIMIPIYVPAPRSPFPVIAGFGGRTLSADPAIPKYVNTPANAVFNKSAILFGLPFAAAGTMSAGRCVITEGYFDVIASHQAGSTEVVAQMGTIITPPQVDHVLALPISEIYFALDSDSAGQHATLRGLLELHTIARARFKFGFTYSTSVLNIDGAKDLDEWFETAADLSALYTGATPAAEFIARNASIGLPDKTTFNDRAARLTQIAPAIKWYGGVNSIRELGLAAAMLDISAGVALTLWATP